jgi:hypothetical protein
MSSQGDTDFRLEKRVTLCAAAVYLPSYTLSNDMGNFDKAKDFLERYNIGLEVWPAGGGKQKRNTYTHPDYEEPIPHQREAYKKLRRDIDEFLRERVPNFPFIVPIIFCHFLAEGVGVTPHSTKIGIGPPACLIRMGASSVKDNMTVVHEMGHAALYPKHHHNKNVGNLMFEAEVRDYMFRFQAEAFATSLFARPD